MMCVVHLAVQVHIPETNAEGQEVIKTGKLWLIDLAGSENISRRALCHAAGSQTCTLGEVTPRALL